MLMGLRNSKWPFILGSALLTALVSIPLGSRAQSPGDVIRIGNSPYQWNQFESYWNQLLNLGGPSPAAQGQATNKDAPSAAVDPQVLQQALVRNLRVSNLQLVPILRLNGSSQVQGSITNGNSKAVTISSVNLDILDANGALVQTTAATPRPATVAPGATVTFSQQLLTVPAD
ncbi:MAG TPA: FxLYD domain-containing protein, partial [Stenomitos sp.]